HHVASRTADVPGTADEKVRAASVIERAVATRQRMEYLSAARVVAAVVITLVEKAVIPAVRPAIVELPVEGTPIIAVVPAILRRGKRQRAAQHERRQSQRQSS